MRPPWEEGFEELKKQVTQQQKLQEQPVKKKTPSIPKNTGPFKVPKWNEPENLLKVKFGPDHYKTFSMGVFSGGPHWGPLTPIPKTPE